MKRLLPILTRLVVALVLGSAGLALAEAAEPPARIVRLPDGRRLALRCSGSGAPTVLLEAGFGASSLAWTKVQPLVAKSNRVCSYDRAGYGLSDPGPLPRDGTAIAHDLDEALAAARIKGPFIGVGHSSGALYIRVFANRHPSNMAGLVLVDPSIEHQQKRLAQAFGPGAGSISGLRERELRCIKGSSRRQANITECRTRLSELDNLWTRTSHKLDAGPKSYNALPLVVLTAADTYRGRAGDLWFTLHDELAARSNRSKHYLVPRSSHLMMLDRPDVIAAAIKEVSGENLP